MKKIIIVLFLFFSPVILCGATSMSYVIDAETNAARHNNLGIIWLREKYYFGAIKEFAETCATANAKHKRPRQRIPEHSL